jgi:hypothetical protein
MKLDQGVNGSFACGIFRRRAALLASARNSFAPMVTVTLVFAIERLRRAVSWPKGRLA